MTNLLNAIQNTCIAISQKEGWTYTASFFYYGQSNIVHVDVYDKNRMPFQNYNVDLDSKKRNRRTTKNFRSINSILQRTTN